MRAEQKHLVPTGTNRTKNAKELNERKTSPGYLKQELKNIPSKTQVVWNNLSAIEDKSSLDFSIPDEKTVKDIVKSAEEPESHKPNCLRSFFTVPGLF